MESSGFLSPKLKYRGPRELKPPTELITMSSPVTGPFPMGLWQAKVVSGLDNHSHRLLLIFKKEKYMQVTPSHISQPKYILPMFSVVG